MVHYFQPNSILEIGTSLGLATAALHAGNPSAKLITLEGCPETQTIAKTSLQTQFATASSIEFVTTEFGDYFNTLEENTSFDLIYFDGNHSMQATLDYFEQLLPTANNNSVWIFDDIHWSTEMQEAWKIIKNHPLVTVTIDTYQWGIVFFRSEQSLAKEHFVIRC
jgi:predicted O-methyltransferase YrrM